MNNPNVIPLTNPRERGEVITARVKAVTDNAIVIDTDNGIINARRAFSCIVAIEVDDIVLVSQMRSVCYVLSILERPESDALAIDFDGDVTMKTRAGKMDLQSAKGINLASATGASITATKLNFTSPEIGLHAKSVDANVNDVTARSNNIRLNTGVLDVVASQISQKTDILVRWVENVETLSIGNLIQKVRKNMTSHSDQAVITASKDMRIDAERIHMG